MGVSVNAAARIMAQAEGGEIVVSDEIRRLAGEQLYKFNDRGPVALRGLREPFHLYSVEW